MTRRRAEMTVALVRQALAGDRSAVRALVDALTPVIQARAARALLRWGVRDVRTEVEDVTQTVLGALFARGGQVLLQWDPERGLSLENFVGLRAEQEVAVILRTRARSPLAHTPTSDEKLDALLADGDVEAGPEQQAASRELLGALVRQMRARLSGQGHELFEMLVVEELPVEEVCALTNLKPDSVYQWRVRFGKLARRICAELVSESGESRYKPPVP